MDKKPLIWVIILVVVLVVLALSVIWTTAQGRQDGESYFPVILKWVRDFGPTPTWAPTMDPRTQIPYPTPITPEP